MTGGVGAGKGVEKWEVQSIEANAPLTKEKRNSSLTLSNISFKEDKHLIVQQVQEYVNSPTKKQLSAKQRTGSPASSPLAKGSADDLEGGGGGH